MRSEWLIREGHPDLIVFFSGWAMDAEPFRFLASNSHDVLVCFDYRMDEGREFAPIVLEEYQRAILISWSMGVLYAHVYLGELGSRFEKRVAVNGTLCPVDDLLGIPEDVFRATLNGLNQERLNRFFRRMHKPGGNFQVFLESRPKRNLDDQRNELEMMLTEKNCFEEGESFYTTAVISGSDYIFPTTNQRRFWQKTSVIPIDGCHFPFYRFSSWEDLLAAFI